jgi:hypothetical protein
MWVKENELKSTKHEKFFSLITLTFSFSLIFTRAEKIRIGFGERDFIWK